MGKIILCVCLYVCARQRQSDHVGRERQKWHMWHCVPACKLSPCRWGKRKGNLTIKKWRNKAFIFIDCIFPLEFNVRRLVKCHRDIKADIQPWYTDSVPLSIFMNFLIVLNFIPIFLMNLGNSHIPLRNHFIRDTVIYSCCHTDTAYLLMTDICTPPRLSNTQSPALSQFPPGVFLQIKRNDFIYLQSVI